MSGHNKWSKIKHKKAVTDTQKSKEFSKISLLIALESKKCGGDINSSGLKSLIERAKAINMPNSNIERAIKKGDGAGAESLEKVVYETYGPGGCAILITALTNNKNRTASEIRYILNKQGFSLASPGSASFMFDSEGNPTTKIQLKKEDLDILNSFMEKIETQDDVEMVTSNAEI